jgi:hypothetical protein
MRNQGEERIPMIGFGGENQILILFQTFSNWDSIEKKSMQWKRIC